VSPRGGAGIGSAVAVAVHGGDASMGLGSAGGHTAAAAVYGPSGGYGEASSGPETAGASFGAESSQASFGAESSQASFGAESSQASFGAESSQAGFGSAGGGIGAGLGQAAFGEPPSGGGPAVDDYQPRHGAPGDDHGAPGDGVGAAIGGIVGGDRTAGPEGLPAAGPLPEPATRGTLYTSAAAAQRAIDEPGDAALQSMQPPPEYHTRVDADGDGRWDRFTAVDRGDGGVDLVVDRNNDGRAEFVGHDVDRDGLIDEASTDTDGDGRLDARWVDGDGDGWLDRRIAMPEPERGAMSGIGERPAPTEGFGPGDAAGPGEPGEGRLRPV
jgi:hypothetical protein